MSTSDDADGQQYWRVNLEGGLPGRIADLWSIQQDLAFVVGCCDRLLARPDDQVVAQALWEASIIAYGRCFAGGKGYLMPQRARTGIPDDVIDQLRGRTVHEAAITDRDKHVAHRVKDHEQLRVTGLLQPPPARRAMVGVAVWGLKLVEREPDDIEALRDLAAQLHDGVAGEIARLQQKAIDTSGPHLDDFYRDADRL